MVDGRTIRDAVRANLDSSIKLLSSLVRFPSTSGREQEAMGFLEEQLTRIKGLEVQRIPLTDTLKEDPDYSDPIPGLEYRGRYNLRARLPGTGQGRSLILNTHLDVVPPSEGMANPWAGDVRDGVVYGRGACDAKGQAACIHLVLSALADLGVRTAGDAIAHLVAEEENGGNGSLAMARRGEQAAGCVVLEPTDGQLHTSIRGAVWFRVQLSGRAGHSGQAGVSRSALLLSREVMAMLERYHARLLEQSRGLPLFDPYPNPMPLTFGRLQAGNWPASAPSRAVLEGVLGFLPNRTKEQVCEEIRGLLESSPNEFLAQHVDLHFMYRHDSSVVDSRHELPRAVLEAAQAAGVTLGVSGMTASCDAWFYNNQLGIPTVVYGPGALRYAHTKDEQISVQEIARAGEVLAHTVLRFGSGTEEGTAR